MEEEAPSRRLVSCMKDGYGDFCLFPPHRLCCVGFDGFEPRQIPSADVDTGEATQLILAKTVSNETESHFPFLDLPKDVRDMIYGYLVETYRDQNMSGTIPVYVSPLLDDSRISANAGTSCAHPYRGGYNVAVLNGANHEPNMSCEKFHGADKVLDKNAIVWTLSQVCRQIRREIGEAFWNNVYVVPWGPGSVLINFLEDRPAVHAGIKGINTKWECVTNTDDLDDKVIPFCEYVAEHLNLDVLQFHLNTSVAIARDIVASKGHVAWIEAFKQIKVKSVEFELWLTGEDPLASEDSVSDDDSDDSYSPVNIKAMEELKPLIEAILNPNESEASPGPLSEQDMYLQARTAELEINV